MARHATRPRYYASRKGYYVCFKGKQYPLAMGEICADCQRRDKEEEIPKCSACLKIFKAAALRFSELMQTAAVDTAEDNALVFAVCTRYLQWVEQHRKRRTYQRAKFFLKKFCEEGGIGGLKIKELKPFHVEDWLAKMSLPATKQTPKGIHKRGWGRSTRRMALDVVLACLNYASKKGFISKNPLSGRIDRPESVSRSKEALVTPEAFQAMLAELHKKYQPRYYKSHGGYFLLFKNRPILLAKGPEGEAATRASAEAKLEQLRKELGVYEEFSVLLRLLHHTGARPGELYHATAADWNSELRAFIYPAHDEPEKQSGFTHKNARKKRERIIFVSDPELVDIITFLCSKYPEGPILRNIKGEPWSDGAAWWRLDSLKEKLRLSSKITPYSFRHTSITDMVLAGRPLALIAEAHGTSIQMIERHYSHPDGHRKAMASWWSEAKGSRPNQEV